MSHLYNRKLYRTCCAVPGCSLRGGTNLLSKIKMYSFPKNKERRTRWILAIRRKDFTPTKYTVICSKHFIEEKPSDDPQHPDWIPSIFPFKEQNQKEVEAKLLRYNRLKNEKTTVIECSKVKAEECVPDVSDISSLEPIVYPTKECGTNTVHFTKECGTNTDFAGFHFDNLKCENTELKKKLKEHEKIIRTMEKKQYMFSLKK